MESSEFEMNYMTDRYGDLVGKLITTGGDATYLFERDIVKRRGQGEKIGPNSSLRVLELFYGYYSECVLEIEISPASGEEYLGAGSIIVMSCHEVADLYFENEEKSRDLRRKTYLKNKYGGE